MPKYFRLEQARRILPELERRMREAVELKDDCDAAAKEVRGVARRIVMLGGATVDHRQVLAKRNRLDALTARLRESLEAIHSTGCQVKDLNVGLVDFPALYRGAEVCLCWKLGEAGIQYWHGIAEGYGGRKPIDADFLEHHQGD